MKDVMLDFETLGNGKNACVTQIGACYFDRQTGAIGRQFSMQVDAVSAQKNGCDLDADTVYWWLKQSPAAIASMIAEPRENIRQAFIELAAFLKGAEHVWSHATFDFVILQETYKLLNIEKPVGFRTARDLRTLVEIAQLDGKDFPRKGVHHNALDDAIYQVGYCVAGLNKISLKSTRADI